MKEERRVKKEWRQQKEWERRRQENRKRVMIQRKYFVCGGFGHITHNCKNRREGD